MASSLLFATGAWALGVNDFTFSHLDMEKGLRCQRVYSLRQWGDGAVWLTTKNGVARYNGQEIAHFSLSDKVTKHTLEGCNPCFVGCDSTVLEVFDAGGRIYRYNAVQKRFDVVADATSLFEKWDNQLNDAYKDGDTYWLALSDGVYKLRGEKLEPVERNIYANCIVRGAHGNLLFGTRQGLKLLRAKDKDAPQARLRRFLPYVVESGFYDSDTMMLWLGTYNEGVVTVDSKGVCREVAGVPHSPVRDFTLYGDNVMLMGVDGFGVYQTSRMPAEAYVASVIFNANEGPNGVLHGNGIYSLLVDKWENIFIGSYSGGVDIARPVRSTLAIYQHQRSSMQSLINDHVNCVTEVAPSYLVMGTDDGVSVLNAANGLWNHVGRGMIVLALCRTPDGHLLAGTYGNGVCEINVQGAVRQVYGRGNGTLDDDHVYDMLFDRYGHLWIGCQDGRLAEVSPQGINYYDVDNVQALALLPDGNIAVGTIRGLFVATPGKREVSELHYFSSDPKKVNRYVLDIYIHDGRRMFIATDGGGLYIYDLQSRECRQLTVADGLPSNTVTSITPDGMSRLWLATDRGLSFVLADDCSSVVDVNYCYGLQREYIRGAALRLADGNLLFGSISGCVVANPQFLQKLNYSALLRFTGATCQEGDAESFNERVAAMLEKGRLSLGYGERTFELFFEAINLRNQFDVAYQYRMGKDEWSQMSVQQYIEFVNLEPGVHHLYVRAVSRTSGVVLDEKELLVSISQPWWNSWWMWCLYVALIVALFYGAWCVYDLHSRFMRLAVSGMENDKKGGAEQSLTEAQALSGIPDAEEVHADEAESDKLDTKFVDAVTRLVLDNLSDSDYTIDRLCKDMAMSRTLFYIKLKSYTGKSPQDFIRVIRLEHAAALLRSGRAVGDVALHVGFDNQKYFSTVFKKYFGVSPSKFK